MSIAYLSGSDNAAAPGQVVRHVLESADLSKDQIRLVLDTAKFMKRQRAKSPAVIEAREGLLMAMIFEKQSLRTRVSFETAFHELGGHSVYLTKSDIDMGKRETIADTAKVLSRWCSVIVARLGRQADLIELASHSSVPVVNALTDSEHPCQALADLLTIEEHLGLDKLRLVWIGDGNNVSNSFAVTAALLGHEVVVCTPPGYEAADRCYRHDSVFHEYAPAKAAVGAHAIYTDVWVSMGQEEEQAERARRFDAYRVTPEIMDKARDDAVFLHCLPAVRGLEVAAEVIDGPQSAVFDQSENRMHVQKALLRLLLEGAL